MVLILTLKRLEQRKYSMNYFYDPHPGFAGAIINLPKPLLDYVSALNEQTKELNEVLKDLQEIAKPIGATVEVKEKFNSIIAMIEENGFTHLFKLIRFKEEK